jgi:hypothetical protein
MERAELEDMVAYYNQQLQEGKRELLEAKLGGSLDEEEQIREVRRLQEIKKARDRFAEMLRPEEKTEEKMAEKFYMKAEETEGQMVYHLSRNPQGGYKKSGIDGVLEDAAKRFGRKKTLATLAIGLGYGIARLQENGSCRITYVN